MARTFPDGTTPVTLRGLDYTIEGGEIPNDTETGEPSLVAADYNFYKALMASRLAVNVTSLSYYVDRGRATLIRRYVREPDKDIEELYGVDVIKDICTAPYFDALTDAQIVAVRTAHDNGEPAAAGWVAKQKNLYMHLARGEESYFLTQFILRVTKHSCLTTEAKASFEDINTVVTAPTLSANMASLVDGLPDGEWLKKPPNVENLGKGRWRVGQEYHWAEKWSIIYGGTWGVAT
jgi:hypothetical protein